MYQLKFLKNMSVFLIVLLLVNSSFALEILTHGSHQHDAAQIGQHETHSIPAMAVMGQTAEQPASYDSVNVSADDCLCDDICCVSSVGFGLGVSGNPIPSLGQSLPGNPNFYSSVSLDLLLPPPTA